jgi:nucleolar protein 56
LVSASCARSDVQRFGKVAKLAAFKPFASAADALEQINAVSEAQLTDDLKNFLTMNLPKVRTRHGAAAECAGHAQAAVAAAAVECMQGVQGSCGASNANTNAALLQGRKQHTASGLARPQAFNTAACVLHLPCCTSNPVWWHAA